MEQDLTANVSIRDDAKQFRQSFTITNNEEKEIDEMTLQTDGNAPTQVQEEGPAEPVEEGPMTREDWAKANSSEVKKLQKYNNLYDRLRKKRDELEILFAQRKFLNLVHEQIT